MAKALGYARQKGRGRGVARDTLPSVPHTRHAYTHIYALNCSKGRPSKPEDGLFSLRSALSHASGPVHPCSASYDQDCQHPFVWRYATNCIPSRLRLCSLVHRPSQTKDHPMEPATRSVASRRIRGARLNYKEAFRLQSCRGHGVVQNENND